MTAVGGPWDVTAGIVALWEAEGLEAEFVQDWPADKRDDFEALEDTEAGEEQPYPYAVYQIGDDVLNHRSGGGPGVDRIEVWDTPVLIRVFAQDKTKARDLARLVATKLESCPWSGCPGWHQTDRTSSVGPIKQDREVWLVQLRYIVRHEHAKTEANGYNG